MGKQYIFLDPSEVESTNAYLVDEKDLGEYLKDAEVGEQVYEVKLVYEITEEYKKIVKEVPQGKGRQE